MLFSTLVSQQKKRAPLSDDRTRRRIPTGTPRLGESSRQRSSRSTIEAWDALLDAVRRSAAARLLLLNGRDPGDRVGCPWERITGCDASCRCGGTATVTVRFLRNHYAPLATEIAKLAIPGRAL